MDSIFPNIDKELEKRGQNYRDLARVVDLSDIQMYRRLRGQTRLQLKEAIKICHFFELYDLETLFARR